MLHPRNRGVSVLLYGAYGMAVLHGAAISLTPPQSIVPVIGELNLIWGIAAIVGSIFAVFGYSRGAAGRLVESLGVALISYAFLVYFTSIVAAFFIEGPGRLTQMTAIGTLVLITVARAATLFVLWYRDRRNIKAITDAVKSIHGNE